MTESFPTDIPLLARFLLADPRKRLHELKRKAKKMDRKGFVVNSPGLRCALLEAWDEEPELFFEIMEPWQRSRNPRVRCLLAGSVPIIDGKFYIEALDLLRSLARDQAREVRLVAVERLCSEVDAVPEEVRRFSSDKDPKVREIVARALRDTREAENFKEELLNLGADRNSEVHWMAAATLHTLHKRAEAVVKECAQRMAESDDVDVRWAIAMNHYAILFGENFERMVTLMRQWIRSGNKSLRWTLAHSLRYVGPSPRLLLIIRTMYADKDSIIRRRIIWQIQQLVGRLDYEEVKDILEKAVRDTSKKVRAQAEIAQRFYQSNEKLADSDGELGDEEDDDDVF